MTQGVYFDTKEAFKIIDDYTQPSNAHRLLRSGWTGSTDFHELPEFIEESNPELIGILANGTTGQNVSWADWASDEEAEKPCAVNTAPAAGARFREAAPRRRPADALAGDRPLSSAGSEPRRRPGVGAPDDSGLVVSRPCPSSSSALDASVGEYLMGQGRRTQRPAGCADWVGPHAAGRDGQTNRLDARDHSPRRRLAQGEVAKGATRCQSTRAPSRAIREITYVHGSGAWLIR